jgi:DNA-binding LacI/PurR family transcriptional regulator
LQKNNEVGEIENLKSPNRKNRITFTEIAAELGVAASTVSNAYNRPDQLSAALRERVFETAARLGYAGPNPAARSLRRGQTGAIGVLYAERLSYAFSDPAAVLFLQGVTMAAEEAGLGILLIPALPLKNSYSGTIANAMVDGFIIYAAAANDPSVKALLERRLPTVIVEQPVLPDYFYVGIDEADATRTATQHLLELGHRRIGIISFRLDPQGRKGLADMARRNSATFELTSARLEGCRLALEEVGVNWADVPVYESPENSPDAGKEAATALLSLPDRPTALVAFSDQLAFGALDAARQLGLDVPTDVSVVGFDDVPAASLTTPGLTTIHQPHIEKGLKAGQLLIAQLNGETSVGQAFLSTRLVVRQSTGARG